jgi:hypothetical protein
MDRSGGLPMRIKRGCCCDGPPSVAYTTRKYDKSDGSTLWYANYFDGLNPGQFVGGQIRRQLYDEDNIYVGGSRVDDGETKWNLVAFDKSDGSIVWKRDTYNDATGLTAGIPKVGDVIAMAIDGDGDIVVMLDSWEATTTYFVWIAPDGTLVDTASYTAPDGYDETRELYSLGFTVDGSGNIHILATDISDYLLYTMDWASPFTADPVVNDIPLNGGTAVKFLPRSMIRYGSRDYIGGSAVNTYFGGDAPPSIIHRSGGVVGASQTAAIGDYSEIDAKILAITSLTDDTMTPTGTNQAGAAALTAGKSYTVSGTNLAGVKLPSGSQGQTIVVKTTDSNNYYLYPSTTGRLVALPGLAEFEADDPVLFGGLGSVTFPDILVCRCVEAELWTIEDLSDVTRQNWNLPTPKGSNIWATEGLPSGITDFTLPFPSKLSLGNRVVKLNSDGQILKWFECLKNQVVVDDDGNFYSYGTCPDTTQIVSTITKRNSSGVYQWGHRHSQCYNITGPCIDIDGDHLYTSGTWSRFDGTNYVPSGPVLRGLDRDNVDDYCEDIACTGSCTYVPTNLDEVETEYVGPGTIRITATKNCKINIALRAGSGGGGGSVTYDVGGGGGGQGEKIFYEVLLSAGQFIDIVLGAGGFGGAWDEGDGNGEDGEDSRVLNSVGGTMATALAGQGGFADGTAGNGGGATVPGDDGQAGGIPTSRDGGDGGGANGAFGTGGVAGTSAEATSGNTSDIDTCGGGGGALGIPLIPFLGDGVGGNGSPGYAVVMVSTWDWSLNEDGDENCSESCTCSTVGDDFYNRYGHPYTGDSTITIRCRRE